MNEKKVFRVYYQTGYSKGCIRVYVAKFFSEQTRTNINKLLKLARTYCTSAQQAALLHDLEEAKQEVSESYFNRQKRIAQLEWSIEKVKAKAWGDVKKS